MSTGFAPARVRPSRRAAAPSRERATETFTAPAGREGSRLTPAAAPRELAARDLHDARRDPRAVAGHQRARLAAGEDRARRRRRSSQAGVDLWKIGELGPDLATSLRRVGIGLAIGLTIGIATGIIAGLLRRGEYLFNGWCRSCNTIPLLAVLPLMIVWFGIDELTKVLLIAFGAGRADVPQPVRRDPRGRPTPDRDGPLRRRGPVAGGHPGAAARRPARIPGRAAVLPRLQRAGPGRRGDGQRRRRASATSSTAHRPICRPTRSSSAS